MNRLANKILLEADICRKLFILNQLTCRRSTSGTSLANNSFTERSHNCGQLKREDVGKQVTLYGWVQYTRFDNKIIALRDSYGGIQCILDKSILTKEFRSEPIHNESVVSLTGIVQLRPSENVNDDRPNGDIEVLANQINVLSRAHKNLPILTRENDNEISLSNRLKNRHLDLRSQHMQEALRFRSKVCQIFRNKLLELGFVDCDTPTLFRRTPGGANEFVVPTKTKDKFYTLTQSPQQLKQLLMIGGLDRYFQICRCYRDESGRSDRQPEFTQIDIELSFTNQTLVMNLVNELMYNLLHSLEFNLDTVFTIGKSIIKLTYKEAIKQYGTDKPDTRFEWLIELSDGGLQIVIPHKLNDDMVNRTLERIRRDKQLDVFSMNVTWRCEANQTTVKVSDSGSYMAHELLGLIRIYLAKELTKLGVSVYREPYKMLWVTEFPLFSRDKQTNKLEPNHHPFTAPSIETAHLLESDPLEVIGQHYDLVLNGQEIAGGSIRIHDAVLQRKIFNDVLKLDEGTFDYFIDALQSGCPPHGGIAFGLDRLIAILLKRHSIRDVIAFPKSNTGKDLMSDSPHDLDVATKQMYNLIPGQDTE